MDEFNPKPWARNPHLQTFFKSLKLMAPIKNPMIDQAKEMIIHGGNDVSLLGYYSAHGTMPPKGLILLLHGWEGSSDSVYILRSGKYFFEKGFDIFRLNLRDHGNSHHLNEGLFHGGLIEETYTATLNIARLSPETPFYILGFSLGGNFALRVAARHRKPGMNNLRHVFAISPVLDPWKATVAIDQVSAFYRRYFRKKWLTSLQKKQHAFPDIYDIDDLYSMNTIMEITECIIPRYSHFRNYKEYFSTYTLSSDNFTDLSIPVTVITAEDDPVIPVEDFYGLTNHDMLDVAIQRYGGHCGFLDPFPFGCWHDRTIYSIIKRLDK